MRRVHVLVVGLLALTGCAKMKADRFCDVAVENGPYADANGRQRCVQEYLDATPAVRTCFDGCRSDTNRFSFGSCMFGCRGGETPAHAWPPASTRDAAVDAR